MPLSPCGNRDLRAYIPSRRAKVPVSVVLGGRYLPVVFDQRRCLHGGRMEPEALEIFPR